MGAINLGARALGYFQAIEVSGPFFSQYTQRHREPNGDVQDSL